MSLPKTPATDLDEAHSLLKRHERLFGSLDPSRENIAKLIAEGIELGRKQGLELGVQLITAEIERIPVGDKV